MAGALAVRESACAGLRERGVPEDPRGEELRRLSATERRMHELAAAGFDVREVAQQLFLTPGTVQAVLEASATDGGGGPGGDGLKFPSSAPAHAGRTPTRRGAP